MIFIAIAGWIAFTFIEVTTRRQLRSFRLDVEDNLLARKQYTQMRIFKRTALIGFLYVDYTVPVEEVRNKLKEVVTASPLWDGDVVNLQVIDTSERNSSAWNLRCYVREELVAWLQANHPSALPPFAAASKWPAPMGRIGPRQRRSRSPSKIAMAWAKRAGRDFVSHVGARLSCRHRSLAGAAKSGIPPGPNDPAIWGTTAQCH